MPLKLLRTQQHYTQTKDEPLHLADRQVDLVNRHISASHPGRRRGSVAGLLPPPHAQIAHPTHHRSQGMSLIISRPFTISTYDPPSTPIALAAPESGHRIGENPVKRSPPPDQDYDSPTPNSADKTPSARAKVLPWVEQLDTDGYQPPEGMFGPYDSQPPSRHQTMHEATVPPPQRSAHPFAYGAPPYGAPRTIPFSALVNQGDPATEDLTNQSGPRPESVLSRGAARYHAQPESMIIPGAEEVPPVPSKSPAKAASASPHRATSHNHQQAVHNKARTAVPRVPVPKLDEPHLHHPHHEFPFSHDDAARKQAEAMAHLDALQKLEATTGAHIPPEDAQKGPRGTYETSTSGPSFGHILHKDGMPLSRHMSMQPPEGPLPLFNIPFGGAIGISIPRPMLFGPGTLGLGTPLGAGLRGSGQFGATPDSLDRGQRRDDRSAYVETVHDEQEPTIPGTKTHAGTRGAPTLEGTAQTPPQDQSLARGPAPARKATGDTPPPGFAPPKPGNTPAPSAGGVPSIDQSRPAGDATPTQDSTVQEVNDLTSALTPFFGSAQAARIAQIHASGQPGLLSPADLGTSPGLPSMTSQMPTQGTLTPAMHSNQGHVNGSRIPSMTSQQPVHGSPAVAPASIAPEDQASTVMTASTTPSNVKRIVANSKFHDDTLCQLLDAARLNLIGEEAKKALNRAARARVIELRDLRARGEAASVAEVQSSRKSHKKDKKSKSSGRRSRHQSHEPEMVPTVNDTPKEVNPPPEWAQDIINRLAAFDQRFKQLESQQPDQARGHFEDPAPELPVTFLDDLLFSQSMPVSAGPRGITGLPLPLGLDPFGFSFPEMTPRSGSARRSAEGGAYIQTLSPSIKPARGANGTLDNGTALSWGSEVELPPPDERVTPPKTPRTNPGPIINIQPPTESNVGKSQFGATASQTGTARTPQVAPIREMDAIDEQFVDLPDAAVPNPRDRDLPPPPSESIRSHRPSPVTRSNPLTQSAGAPTTRNGDTNISLREALGPYAHATPTFGQPPLPPMFPIPPLVPSEMTGGSQTVYKTALQTIEPKTPPQVLRDKIHIAEHESPKEEPKPWDLVTQRLYSWALIWEESTFNKAMEDISLGKQVEEFALTIFVMMTFKRMLRRNLTDYPRKVCDKLFVPPTMAEAINQAVHAQQYNAAKQMLEELWYPFLFKDPPRVIIALCRHRNDHDVWTAHRFDLSSGHLRSYRVCHNEGEEHDGRPFRWWHAIREAWPQYKICDPSELKQQTTTQWTPRENKNNNSLLALNYARNLFLGFRPENPSDLVKLRESVWGEVKRLREKKRGGKLLVENDTPPTHPSF